MPILPDQGALRVSQPLTNISVGWQQGPDGQRFVANAVFPVVPVARQGDLYWKYNKGDWFRGQAAKRAPATESVGAGWSTATDTYYAHVYALHKDIDDQTRANASDMFSLDRDATQFVTGNLLAKRENLFVGSFMTTSVWTGGTATNGGSDGGDLTGHATGTSANQFKQWDASGSDPILDVNRQIIGMARKTGYRPNVLVMGPWVFEALTRNAAILNRILYAGGTAIVTEDLLRQVFNVDRLVVTWAIQNASVYGATDSFDFMNGKSALLCYAAPNPGLMQPSAGYIFAWTGLLGAGAFGTRMKRFRMEAIESDRIEGEMAFDMKIVSSELGVFFNGAVA